jgi:hypothetical protein
MSRQTSRVKISSPGKWRQNAAIEQIFRKKADHPSVDRTLVNIDNKIKNAICHESRCIRPGKHEVTGVMGGRLSMSSLLSMFCQTICLSIGNKSLIAHALTRYTACIRIILVDDSTLIFYPLPRLVTVTPINSFPPRHSFQVTCIRLEWHRRNLAFSVGGESHI